MEGFSTIDILTTSDTGDVSLVRQNSDSAVFACQAIKFAGLPGEIKEELVAQVNRLISLNSLYTVKFRRCFVDQKSGCINLLQEYYPLPNLKSRIAKAAMTKTPFSEDEMWKIITGVALALYECHLGNVPPIAHGAVCSSHIFFDSDNRIKLGGFDFSHINQKNVSETPIERDMYNFGKLIFELATLSPPSNSKDVNNELIRGVGEGVRELISRLIRSNPKKRYTIQDVLSFPEVSLKVLEEKVRLEEIEYEETLERYNSLRKEVKQLEKGGDAA